jgi:hypothetical protein
MVRLRPDPRGVDFHELFKSQTTGMPFSKVSIKYYYYRWMDHALKAPFVAMPATFATFFAGWFFYSYFRDYMRLGAKTNKNYMVNERLFEYPANAADRRHIRGEWNNNFYCWTDSPDCGKDFKQRYFS